MYLYVYVWHYNTFRLTLTLDTLCPSSVTTAATSTTTTPASITSAPTTSKPTTTVSKLNICPASSGKVNKFYHCIVGVIYSTCKREDNF